MWRIKTEKQQAALSGMTGTLDVEANPMDVFLRFSRFGARQNWVNRFPLRGIFRGASEL